MADKGTFSNIWTKIGGRKLIAFLFGLGALVGLAFAEKLTDTAMWGIIGLAASFAGGNAAEHIASVFRTRGKAIPATPESPDEEDSE